ncbi:Dam family site-specific DNA-(adenine-N6)-methyltransferase [Xenorhabdus budapestensis]|uniref:Site-specific DNA-methyltransferase (adenine-specific) n=1 Tax=Xenorhabdus budapestensis TaxID=290110 RepID=A0ABX7VCF2_XENBU|nr:Dam family site-specific DNA-(adenine-N6)-methyltransferase [Xenorhabdus budapestensis]QTL38511.1 Dam family site-specific DNA-(adenine-N6)-methyltransferase [Xenorhabdus budapestensis]
MANKTILKWAGSKARIMDKLLPHLPAGKRLVEPFAGSCAVMMNTDYPAYLVADVNADLIDMYQSIKTDCDQFTKAAANWFSFVLNKDEFYELRNVFNFSGEFSGNFGNKLDRASLFLALNRHCFNGLCRYNRKGKFNVPFGNYKKPYFPAAEIWAFADKSQAATLHYADWQDTLIRVEHGDVVYCDPPYLAKGKTFTQYHKVNFIPADHELLAMVLHTLHHDIGVPVTVSNSIEAKELYADLGFTIHEIDAPRTIAANGNRQPAKEIIAVLEACA